MAPNWNERGPSNGIDVLQRHRVSAECAVIVSLVYHRFPFRCFPLSCSRCANRSISPNVLFLFVSFALLDPLECISKKANWFCLAHSSFDIMLVCADELTNYCIHVTQIIELDLLFPPSSKGIPDLAIAWRATMLYISNLGFGLDFPSL